MSTIFDALKKASQERKLHVTKPLTQGLEERLYRPGEEPHASAPTGHTGRPIVLISGIVTVLAVVTLAVVLVVMLSQRPDRSRVAVAVHDDVQPVASPTAIVSAESRQPRALSPQERPPAPRMLTVVDLTAQLAPQPTPLPEQTVQPPTIIKINLQPAAPAVPAAASGSALPVPATIASPLSGEQVPDQQIISQPSSQPISPSSSEPGTQPAPAVVDDSATPVREEGKTFGLILEGIVWDKTRPLAMINGRIIEEGDKIEGVRVVKIEKTAVEIEKDGTRYSIKY
jgi:hypothetical protein